MDNIPPDRLHLYFANPWYNESKVSSPEVFELVIVEMDEYSHHGDGFPFVCFIDEKKIYMGDKSGFHFDLFSAMENGGHLHQNYLSDMEELGNYFIGRSGGDSYGETRPHINQ